MEQNSKITVIGMWHLGCVTASCLAKLGNKVTCFDFDEMVISDLVKQKLPIKEPGLDELFNDGIKNRRLFFTQDLKHAVDNSEVILIAFDTPVDENDKIDLTIINKTIDSIIPLLKNESATIVVSSQVPVGTCDKILEKLKKSGKKNEVSHIPENLRLGTAINSFMNPERIVVGVSNPVINRKIEKLFSGITTKYCFMSLKSAEMTKHALNSYLATLISFSGEISDLCEKLGANAVDVFTALKSEKRVSPYAPVMPGLGFGGGTLARDVNILRDMGKNTNTKTQIMNSVITFNKERMHYVRNRLIYVLGSLKGKKVAFLGLTYKAGTNTLRRSLTLQVINKIKDDEIFIKAFDPMIKDMIDGYEFVKICKSYEEAFENSDALVLMNDCEEFKSIDYEKFAKLMHMPIIIDTKNMLDSKRFSNSNIKYFGVGC